MVSILKVAVRVTAILAFGCVLSSVEAQAPPPFPPTPADIKTGALFLAINHSAPSDVSTVRAAEAAGADIHRKNWLGYTPLMWASVRGKTATIEMLIKQGAHINDSSPYGSALTFSLIGRQRTAALALLAHGASIKPERLDRTTPLMYAAADGYDDVLKALLKRGARVNAADLEEVTALVYAVRTGHRTCANLLLKAGASVSAVDIHGRTPLMEAAMCGQSEIASDLIAAHANVNAKDKSGNSALALAARYSGNPEVVQLLLKHGTVAGSSLSIAANTGRAQTAAVIAAFTHAKSPAIPTITPNSVIGACDKGVRAIENGLAKFQSMAPCGACHHQGLGLMSLGVAAERGVKVDGKVIGAYLQQLGEDGKHMGPVIHNALAHPEVKGSVQAVDIEDMAIGAGYMFNAMLSHHVPANPGLAETAAFLASLQAADGRWIYGIDREPMQSSQVTTTAMICNILVQYGGGAEGPLAENIRKAKQYLGSVQPTETEDAAMKLMGLHWVGASAGEIATANATLRKMQNKDGSWSQKPGTPGDAYATGMAVYALRTAANASAEESAVKQGVRYLVYTQGPQGAWFVNKRTNSANNYFDSGFPYGESQYSSLAGSCWAVMALSTLH